MIYEIAVTPEAFREACLDAEQSGLDALRGLLFPRGEASNVLVADLCSDEWQQAVGKVIAKLSPSSQKRAKTLFEKMLKDIIIPYASDGNAPSDESGWVTEAEQACRRQILDGVVVTYDRSCAKSDSSTYSLADLKSPKVLDAFANCVRLRRDSESQEPVLRRLCRRSGWMVFALPHMRGGSDDESVTALQLIDLFAQSIARASRLELDLLLKLPGDKGSSHVKNIGHSLREALGRVRRSIRVRVFRSPDVVDRELIAGMFTQIDGDPHVRRATWLVGMNHVAIRRRAIKGPWSETSWTLFSRRKAQHRYEIIESWLTRHEPVIEISSADVH